MQSYNKIRICENENQAIRGERCRMRVISHKMYGRSDKRPVKKEIRWKIKNYY